MIGGVTVYDKAQLIIRLVSLQYGVSVNDLTRKGKTKHVLEAKKECRRRLRNEADLSWREINEFLGYSLHYHRL